jgi:hypothetical protein
VAKKSVSARDIGEMGQDHFKLWCTDNGLSAVAAKPDRFGWDFFVEFEPEIDSDLPLDRQGDLVKTLAQIKATEAASSPRSVSVKLSALKRLIDTPLPAFLAHIEYRKGQQKPARARLLHVGPTQIEQVLRKIRQTEKEGRLDIQNVRMSLPLDEAMEIALDGTNLRDLMRSVCLSSPEEYATTKASLRKSCGYDRNSIIVSFLFAEGMTENSMVDLMLGYAPDLPIEGATVTTSRFGISLDKETRHIGSGRMSVEVKPFRRGKVRVLAPGRSQGPTLDIDVFAPGIPGLSDEERRIRLKNDFIDIALHFGQGRCTIRFNIDPDVKLPIDQLANVLAFGVALADSGAVLEYEIGSYGWSKIFITDEFRSYRAWRTLHEFVEMLAVALFRHRRGQVFQVSLNEMSEALDKNRNMFAASTRAGANMTFLLPEEIPGAIPDNRAIFMPVCIEFGEFVYHAVVKANAGATLEGDRIRLVGDKPIVVEDGITERSNLDVKALNKRASDIGRSMSDRTSLIVTATVGDGEEDE